ncbi:hypothetical protein Q5P01_016875 [Channa striata]|uniref:Uncharacterized protein n=1 Tax=Channa striata TaxID=64152 RepID=A0AA88SD45_CHASR|nr:hypothetical protein Q5P01_016875 [Channa striata]
METKVLGSTEQELQSQFVGLGKHSADDPQPAKGLAVSSVLEECEVDSESPSEGADTLVMGAAAWTAAEDTLFGHPMCVKSWGRC